MTNKHTTNSAVRAPGTVLAALRKDRGASRQELAAVAQRSLGFIRNLEQDTIPLTTASAVALAAALHEIRRLTPTESAALASIGVPAATLADLAARKPAHPPALADLPPEVLAQLHALLEHLGPDRFSTLVSAALLTAQASAPPATSPAPTPAPAPAPAPITPRLITEEVDAPTNTRWRVAIADPAFSPQPHQPPAAAPPGGQQSQEQGRPDARKKRRSS